MPSIHYKAERIEEALNLRLPNMPPPRSLSNDEVKSIERLSKELEKLTFKWIETVNSTDEWKRYHSRSWHEGYGWYKPEPLKKSKELYLYASPEDLYYPGLFEEGEPAEESFFGFTNIDDIEANFRVIPFIEEYVRRLSGLITDLVWLFDYQGEAFYRGRPIIIKRHVVELPPRTAPRRDSIPEYVHKALSPSEEKLPPLKCIYCGKSDEKVTPQFIKKPFTAHEPCLTRTCRNKTAKP